VLNVLKEDAERCHTDYEAMLNEDAEGNPRDPSAPRPRRRLRAALPLRADR
jgi:hypothetical protein